VLRHSSEEDIYGVNDRVQLAYAEKILRRRKNYKLMYAGVTIIDPDATFIDDSVNIGKDTVVFPFTFLAGNTEIGENCRIGPGTFINDSIVGNATTVEYSRVREARIGDECTVGPYSYLRPETVIGNQVKIGDFVELKKTVVGEKSKIPHLSYVGDAIVGKSANIGAGTITCNYDGKNKYVTIIEDHAFIGSNTNLIAPITIGRNAVTGAGSSLSHDVPPDSLAVERAQAKVKKKRE
jgi:bifunctional UDP-N-acetylglucosamine pyrophosphorylase/glucosamine-1-phosphate N-acetyltransferase